ncbi:hypothetical protein [Roseospira goensis]|uniref:Uncharacterized protein n=1 Tax=Roseospira goensis TaxID=391922 RepID=A0A7W6S282_9PROT|nr:hypothetical protein [Roseospira goensis]MBB4287050.1 hypothetical protein [Roseospira goensis]
MTEDWIQALGAVWNAVVTLPLWQIDAGLTWLRERLAHILTGLWDLLDPRPRSPAFGRAWAAA